jgi:hypothetical protein
VQLTRLDKLKRRANARPTRSGPVRQNTRLYGISTGRSSISSSRGLWLWIRMR